ncbi:hypothetical protein HBI56_126580 [Parastagonospora nodorum]|nr:hypothetical protein HBH53_105800 [Parastagonospora nodorum]KAH3968710.1 hypothetical protein HBH51_129710 [Parastagonospora nodorum]KAH3989261.1 hypothetical protein HBH52_012250 [Parastagonospora nodorum]KAH3997287.1 hypothetical protein HBI10_145840 [Parastagonospora nodorum]KAH4019873.1 hypothetical protein HBI13_118990 [Parastagonospora nodorum]
METKTETARADEVYSAPRKQGGIINKLYPPGPQPGAKGRVKNHCRKFWWCDCLVFAIIVLIIVLPIIYVAIPNKAQDEINKSTLEVTSQEVTSPTENGVHLKLESVIRSDSSYHPTIDSFRAALSLDGQDPFIHIQIPEAKSEAETRVSVDQDAEFTSLEAFTAYTKTVLGAETFNVNLRGKTNIHLKGLPTMDVDYNKVVSMKGLNKLKGLNITSIKLLSGQSELLADGSNMVGEVYIPNPSVMTLDLGNVTMNLAIDSTSIGTALLPNLVLKPGDNNVPMQAKIQPLDVLSLVQTKYKNAIVPLSITGNSTVRNGVTLKYYEDALKSNTVNVDLNVGPALSTLGINITQS